MPNPPPLINAMLAKKFEKHEHRITYPCLAQPKLGGVRMIWDGSRWYSRSHKPLSISPGLESELRADWAGIPLDGELYEPTLTFEAICGSVRRKEWDGREIGYHVFDTMSPQPSWQRQLVPPNNPLAFMMWIRQVETCLVKERSDLDVLLERWISEGFEGLMVRDYDAPYIEKRTNCLLKWKRWIKTTAVIIGFIEGKGKHIGRLGALRISGRTDNEVCWECSVGTGFSDSDRDYIWSHQSRSIGRAIKLKYQEVTRLGVPRFPVFEGMEASP